MKIINKKDNIPKTPFVSNNISKSNVSESNLTKTKENNWNAMDQSPFKNIFLKGDSNKKENNNSKKEIESINSFFPKNSYNDNESNEKKCDDVGSNYMVRSFKQSQEYNKDYYTRDQKKV